MGLGGLQHYTIEPSDLERTIRVKPVPEEYLIA